MPSSHRMSPMKLSTAVKRLQKSYGKDKIDRQLVLDMLETMGTQPYYSQIAGDYWIDSFDYYEIDAYIYSYPLGAPVDEIFNIGIVNSKE